MSTSPMPHKHTSSISVYLTENIRNHIIIIMYNI